MTKRQSKPGIKGKRGSPMGTVAGLLTAFGVTLIGMAVGLDPDVILWRAVTSGVLIGFLISFGMSVIHVANTTRSRNGFSRRRNSA
jgi:flagellar biosynthesis protein FliR